MPHGKVESSDANLSIPYVSSMSFLLWSMELDACLRQALKPPHEVDGLSWPDQVVAHRVVGRVYRDIQRRCVSFDDPFKLRVVHVRKRHIVAHHERKTPVVVFHLHGRSDAFGKLVYEAEPAMVHAHARRRQHVVVELQAKRLVFVFFKAVERFFLTASDQQIELFIAA